jgi:hypothetical protein
VNGTGIGLISFSCPLFAGEGNIDEFAIYEQANASKSRTISWNLCALSRPDLEGAQMEKYLTPTCLEVRKERLTAMRDIEVKSCRGAGNENWEGFRYFVQFLALSDWPWTD